VVTTEGGHCASRSLFSDYVGSAGFFEQNAHFPSFVPSRNSVSIEKFKGKKAEMWGILFDILLIL
jgi:hypothetical protein